MSAISEKLSAVADLIRLDRQYGTLLLLAPTLWSLVLATDGRPSLLLLAIFVLGTFLMRGAGCAINDFADREYDGRVERTMGRPIPSGRLRPAEALFVFALLAAAAFGLVLLLNRITILLSIAGIGVVILYPFAKRVTHLPQVILGVAFSWGSLMAWTAARGRIETPALLIFVANLFWTVSYDTVYALMDREDDVAIGVKSTALLFGQRSWLAVALLLAASSAALIGVGLSAHLGWVYFVSLIGAAVLFGHQVGRIRGEPDRASLFSTFRANVRIGFLILLGIVIDLWT